MTIEEQIEDVFKQECNRVADKTISGFYYTFSEYNGTSIYDEI